MFKSKIFKDLKFLSAFHREVQGLSADELLELGLEPCSHYGDFSPHRLQELRDFCRRNPNYHIISCHQATMYFNRLYEWCDSFSIGRGSKDPTISLIGQMTLEQYQKCLISELARHEFSSEPDKLWTIQQAVLNF